MLTPTRIPRVISVRARRILTSGTERLFPGALRHPTQTRGRPALPSSTRRAFARVNARARPGDDVGRRRGRTAGAGASSATGSGEGTPPGPLRVGRSDTANAGGRDRCVGRGGPDGRNARDGRCENRRGARAKAHWKPPAARSRRLVEVRARDPARVPFSTPSLLRRARVETASAARAARVEPSRFPDCRLLFLTRSSARTRPGASRSPRRARWYLGASRPSEAARCERDSRRRHGATAPRRARVSASAPSTWHPPVPEGEIYPRPRRDPGPGPRPSTLHTSATPRPAFLLLRI